MIKVKGTVSGGSTQRAAARGAAGRLEPPSRGGRHPATAASTRACAPGRQRRQACGEQALPALRLGAGCARARGATPQHTRRVELWGAAAVGRGAPPERGRAGWLPSAVAAQPIAQRKRAGGWGQAVGQQDRGCAGHPAHRGEGSHCCATFPGVPLAVHLSVLAKATQIGAALRTAAAAGCLHGGRRRRGEQQRAPA